MIRIVPKRGLCRDLLLALSSACSLKYNEKILLVEIQNHLINCFLEEPLLIHRREEENPGSSQRRTEWNPYGTPPVSSIWYRYKSIIASVPLRAVNCGNSNVTRKLPLLLVDEHNACIDLSVGEKKAVKITSSSRSILVYVKWSQKLLA
ncbi:hypothetical protein POM88_047267 [Heracleum sosnowskyi]|uniref:Uncharacterized protein n=1 Tax=Heracleum sosnowskyi TaxID=360622 RepID=A0AAD8GTZ3_9APIA|nr:hypothetical protein POM88_047267 [Heracleum sosnowskyi]